MASSDTDYLLEHTDGKSLARQMRDSLYSDHWQINYFKAEERNTYTVYLRADGSLQLFSRSIAEDEPGAQLERPEAITLAEDFLQDQITAMTLDLDNIFRGIGQGRPHIHGKHLVDGRVCLRVDYPAVVHPVAFICILGIARHKKLRKDCQRKGAADSYDADTAGPRWRRNCSNSLCVICYTHGLTMRDISTYPCLLLPLPDDFFFERPLAW